MLNKLAIYVRNGPLAVGVCQWAWSRLVAAILLGVQRVGIVYMGHMYREHVYNSFTVDQNE